MDFQVEISDFSSMVHASVYSAARGLTPLSRSLLLITDPEMRASCTAFHAFLTDMFSDMYDHAEAYHLPVGLLEDFCGGRKVNGVKQKYPSRMKNILAQTRNAVRGYIVTLFLLGRLGAINGDILAVSPGDIEAIHKHVSSSTSPIALDKRLNALARVGLSADGNRFISTRHPKMFPAMCALARNAEKPSGFDFFAFYTAEFRSIAGKYKPTPEDYFNPLLTDQRGQAEKLHNYATEKKLKPVISTFWKVDYKYRGTQVLCIGSERDYERLLDIRVWGTYSWDDIALINNRLLEEPREFKKYALRHIWRCDACSTSHLGSFITILGKRQRVCGGGMAGFRWYNPGDADLDAIKKIILIRCEIIDTIKSREQHS